MKSYTPQSKQAELLNWCLEKIKAVPYRVSLRWIFYRAVQEKGLTKSDYENFKKWLSRARKGFWNGWAPNTLVDDTRRIVEGGRGYASPDEWMKSLKDSECVLDKQLTQPNIVIVCFEAEAMYAQFLHYTKSYYVSLVPFKGDQSIALKWDLAVLIDNLRDRYGKPVKVLYFGDLDKKGEEIPENAMRDVEPWSLGSFSRERDYERVGLNEEHIDRWHLPENPEKAGYQWEALPDVAAKELIQTALSKYVNLEEIKKVEDAEAEATEKWRGIMEEVLK